MTPTQTVRMNVLWLWKIMFGIGVLFFGIPAVASLGAREWTTAVGFMLFTALTAFTVALSLSYVGADAERLTMVNPLLGRHVIRWSEIERVETNRVAYVFRGNEKALGFNALMGDGNSRALRSFVDQQIAERGIEVQMVVGTPSTMPKNTRVK